MRFPTLFRILLTLIVGLFLFSQSIDAQYQRITSGRMVYIDGDVNGHLISHGLGFAQNASYNDKVLMHTDAHYGASPSQIYAAYTGRVASSVNPYGSYGGTIKGSNSSVSYGSNGSSVPTWVSGDVDLLKERGDYVDFNFSTGKSYYVPSKSSYGSYGSQGSSFRGSYGSSGSSLSGYGSSGSRARSYSSSSLQSFGSQGSSVRSWRGPVSRLLFGPY